MNGRVHRIVKDRVAVLEIENPPMNALSQGTRRALADALARAEAETEIGAIVIAARGSVFVGSTELDELGQKPLEPHLPDLADRIEASAKPIVVAWHGVALSGGCEIGLAAHRRVMAKDARIGLPEVKLGLVPGAGGTQRLPRLIGLPAALDLIATGRLVGAKEALAIGLCDEIADGNPVPAATRLAQSLIGKMQPRLSLRAPPPPENGSWDAMIARVRREARGRIAPLRAIELVGHTLTLPYSAGAQAERHGFLDLLASDQSRALRYLFAAENAARRIAGPADTKPLPLRRIGIVGAGAMGVGIAILLAEHGFPVAILEAGDAGLAAGRERLGAALFRHAKTNALPDSRRAELASRITLGPEVAALAVCDLAIEAVSEDLGIKDEVIARLEGIIRHDALIATTTGYLDIEALANGMMRPERLIGLHFFAPAQATRIVEIAQPRRARREAIATALDLVRRLDRLTIPCGASEGLIGNRMLGKFRAQCEFMLEEGAMPAEIDSALEAFGLALGPFAAQDMAGLDIAHARRKRQAVIRNPAERDVPLVDRLHELGRLGQKAGRGWYRYAGGHRQSDPEIEALIRDHAMRSGRRRQSFTPALIQARIVAAMANEGARLLEDGVARRPLDIDLVMVHGFGFPTWRGGPMQEADARGLRGVLAIAQENAARDGAGFEVSALLGELAQAGGNFASRNNP